MARIRANLSPKPAITVSRAALESENIAYLITTNKAITYSRGKSQIAYIGHSKIGARRLLNSAAERSSLLKMHGVTEISVFCVSADALEDVNTANKLESALLCTFLELYGELPIKNQKGGGQRDWETFFTTARIQTLLKRFEG